MWPADWEIWNDPRLCGSFKERLIKADGSAHPCQMPLSVLQRAIAASSNVGDLVLDPFSGTATTAMAAAMLGRQYIAIEQSAEYVALGLDRLGTIAPPVRVNGDNSVPDYCELFGDLLSDWHCDGLPDDNSDTIFFDDDPVRNALFCSPYLDDLLSLIAA